MTNGNRHDRSPVTVRQTAVDGDDGATDTDAGRAAERPDLGA